MRVPFPLDYSRILMTVWRLQGRLGKMRFCVEDFSGPLVTSGPEPKVGGIPLAHPTPQLQCHQCENKTNPSACKGGTITTSLTILASYL